MSAGPGPRQGLAPLATRSRRGGGSAVPTLDRPSPVPFYHQLKAILLEQTSAPAVGTGPVRLPTEKERTERDGVSRPVVRQAMRVLVSEGYVVREQGRGTAAVPRRVRPAPQPDTARTLGLSGYLKVHGMRSS